MNISGDIQSNALRRSNKIVPVNSFFSNFWIMKFTTFLTASVVNRTPY